MSALAILLFLAAFSFNPIVQFGLGAREIFLERDEGIKGCVVRAAGMFLSALILWHITVFILYPLTLGFLSDFLLFPLSFLVCFFCGRAGALAKRKKSDSAGEDSASGERFERTVSNALFVFLAVFLTIKFALNSQEAIILSGGFFSGLIFSTLIIKAIRRRAAKEKPPETMRGLPLMLVTMALISLIFSGIGAFLFAR